MAAGEPLALCFACIARAGEVPVMTGPEDPAGAGRDRLRAGHADREQVIGTLKDAFMHGRLTRDELDARAGRALSARTYADLAALTADIPAADIPAVGIPPVGIPPVPAVAGTARPPAPVRRRPLARAAAGSGACLIIAAAAWRVATIVDPGARPPRGPARRSRAASRVRRGQACRLYRCGAEGAEGHQSSAERRRR
jgi:hypothetical protein